MYLAALPNTIMIETLFIIISFLAGFLSYGFIQLLEGNFDPDRVIWHIKKSDDDH